MEQHYCVVVRFNWTTGAETQLTGLLKEQQARDTAKQHFETFYNSELNPEYKCYQQPFTYKGQVYEYVFREESELSPQNFAFFLPRDCAPTWIEDEDEQYCRTCGIDHSSDSILD